MKTPLAPRDVLEALASQASSHGVSWNLDLQPVKPKKFPHSFLVPGRWHLTGSAEGRATIASLVERSMSPASDWQIEQWLAELDVISAHRAEDDFTAALKLRAYVDRLNRFPADAVHHALLGLPWAFFPSWDELQKALDLLCAPRRTLLRALREPPEDGARPRNKPDAARRAEILRENGFGHLVGPRG
ncbi:hypothetical protein [Sagittula salina]|uniref:Uncharacterized protein n=1 Tax=Sagittula salina TaxID=2820268 RepID=A0A940S1Y3_9RHOB|nr:hypothetical protein [Sagittula salina]MBP0484653.1 hypothetical protein [Sagittula salina]